MNAKKTFLKKIRSTFSWSFLTLTLVLQACGGSSGAGPVSIPAPATANIRISSPDSNSLVTVTGSAGAVTANYTVQVTNTTLSTGAALQFIEELILRTAWAQTATTVTTTAAADGSFSVQITAEEDDALEIVAINPDTNEQSDPLEASVPDNVPPLSFSPMAITVDNNNRAYAVGTSGGTGIVAIIDLDNNTVLSTFNLITNDPQGVAFDPGDNELVIADTDNDTVLFVELADTTQQRAVDVQGPQSVAVDTVEDLAVIGTSNVANSVVLIDLATENPSATAAITNVDDATATYQGSPSVDAAGGIGVLVSNFDDGSAQATTKDLNPPTFTNQQAFANSSFRGSAFTGANEAIVVDEDNDRALIVDLTGVAAASAVTVGSDPEEVAVDLVGNQAYVTNNGAHTVSVIDLTSQTVTSTENAGINPGDVAYSSSASAAVVANTGSNSVTIIE